MGTWGDRHAPVSLPPGKRLGTHCILGASMAQRLRCCATNRKVAGSIPASVIGILYWHKILPIAPWPWVRFSLQQKWVPGAFPGDKGGRCVRLTTLPPSWAVVMKSGNLNFLETSGPLQACNGTALPLLAQCARHCCHLEWIRIDLWETSHLRLRTCWRLKLVKWPLHRFSVTAKRIPILNSTSVHVWITIMSPVALVWRIWTKFIQVK